MDDGEKGRQKAIQRAESKAGQREAACLVYVKIERRIYDGLRQAILTPEEATAAYNQYARSGETGYDVICGPVLRKNGQEIHPTFPLQYKFEGDGTRALSVHGIVMLTHEEKS